MFLNSLCRASLLLVACSLQSCTQLKNNLNKPIIFGMLAANAPFMGINQKCQYEGFDVDIALEIGKIINRKIQIIDMGMSELLIALDRQKIDALMCGLNLTKARLKQFNMVHYQGARETKFPLIFWNHVPLHIKSMEDLRGQNFTIAVVLGSLQEMFVRQFDFVNCKIIDNYADIILELQYGKVHAALVDGAIESYVKQFSQFKIINIPVGSFKSSGHGIAIHKDNTKLTQQIEQAVGILKQNGVIVCLEKRWKMNGEGSNG